MLKLLSLVVLLSSLLEASNADVEKFLKKSFSKNPNIVKMDVKVKQKVKLKKLKSWEAYVVSVKATVKTKAKNRVIKQNMVWFSNGQIITQDLVDIKSGKSLKDTDLELFKDEFYKKGNLISGNLDAKHKVVIFSDPLCPFCKKLVPKALKYMMKRPNEYAVYYFHLPLLAIHPASNALVKAAVVAEHQGIKDVVLNLYKVKVSARESDVKKILKAFNKVMKTDIKESDIKKDDVLKQIDDDAEVAASLMVSGTPSMYLDGKKDNIAKYK